MWYIKDFDGAPINGSGSTKINFITELFRDNNSNLDSKRFSSKAFYPLLSKCQSITMEGSISFSELIDSIKEEVSGLVWNENKKCFTKEKDGTTEEYYLFAYEDFCREYPLKRNDDHYSYKGDIFYKPNGEKVN